MPLRAASSRDITSSSSALRRHLLPVRGPEIGAEDGDVAILQPAHQLRRVGEAGKAEEGHMRASARRAEAGRVVDRREALVDVGLRRGSSLISRSVRAGWL